MEHLVNLIFRVVTFDSSDGQDIVDGLHEVRASHVKIGSEDVLASQGNSEICALFATLGFGLVLFGLVSLGKGLIAVSLMSVIVVRHKAYGFCC